MTSPPEEPTPQDPTPWYAAGLRFECTRCGRCCTGAGTVRVDGEEQVRLAEHLGIGLDAFRARYLRRLPDGELSLVEKPDTDCVFWEREAGCAVYAVRPRQCRTWPFWRGNVATRAHWDSAAEGCPGMNEGPLHDAGHVARTAAADGTSGIVPDLTEWTWEGDGA